MQTQDFEDYAREKVARHGPTPLSGSFEVTARCNLRCAHCYMCAYRKEPELSTEEAKRILDELAEAGSVWLLITGGEPLLRPDFREIWSYAKRKGFLLTLFTNATLVDAELAAFLRDLPPLLCEVSLYGASAETYVRVCGDPTAFEAALAGLDRLREAVPHLNVKGMAMRENLEDMEAIGALCSERGLEFSFDTDIFPRLDRDPAPLDHALPPEEGVRRVLSSPLHRKVWAEQSEKWKTLAPKPLKRADKLVTCRAGESSFHVGPYGDLCLCMLLREPFFSLRRGRFLDGWNSTIRSLVECEKTASSPCADCPDLKYCVPCAGRNFLETGSPEKLAPVLCRRSRAIRERLEEHAAVGEEIADYVRV